MASKETGDGTDDQEPDEDTVPQEDGPAGRSCIPSLVEAKHRMVEEAEADPEEGRSTSILGGEAHHEEDVGTEAADADEEAT